MSLEINELNINAPCFYEDAEAIMESDDNNDPNDDVSSTSVDPAIDKPQGAIVLGD